MRDTACCAAISVFLSFFFVLLVLAAIRPEFNGRVLGGTPESFFVFGDSYADTGNRDKASPSWNVPYGITWPGVPSGRFSNGLHQTDFLAQALRLPSPIPYARVNGTPPSEATKYGINFAVGGSGVTAAYGFPTLSQQIDHFNTTLNLGLFSPATVAGSLAFVSVSGNDYGAFTGDLGNINSFVETVVSLVALGLTRLAQLGIANAVVLNLPPFGCSPSSTIFSNFTQCSNSSNELVSYHNQLLDTAVQDVNRQWSTRFILLNQTQSFLRTIGGSPGIPNPLRPCCEGITSSTSCGDVDSNGDPAYTVCDNPDSHLFWDSAHPTQLGWAVVVNRYLRERTYISGHPALTLQDYFNSITRPQILKAMFRKGRGSSFSAQPSGLRPSRTKLIR